MTTAMKAMGCVGAVSNGPSRDIDEIRPMKFQYLISGISPGHGGQDVYAVMPAFEAEAVIERDVDQLMELYDLPFAEVAAYISRLRAFLLEDEDFLEELAVATRRFSSLPDRWHDAGFGMIEALLDPNALGEAVDQELSAWGKNSSMREVYSFMCLT